MRPICRLASVLTVGATCVVLGACGSSSGGGSSPSSTSSTSRPAFPGGGSGIDFTKVTACLKAAGIDVPTPTGTPSGVPTDLPTAGATAPPTGPGAGGFAQLNTPKARAALKACGITLGAGAAPTPT
jgi:hypothetical protein